MRLGFRNRIFQFLCFAMNLNEDGLFGLKKWFLSPPRVNFNLYPHVSGKGEIAISKPDWLVQDHNINQPI